MSLVGSKITCGAQIWRPQYNDRICFLSKLQNRLIRHLSYIDGNAMHPHCHDYSEVSKRYNFPSLESTIIVNDVNTLVNICSSRMIFDELRESILWDNRSFNSNLRFPFPFYLDINSSRYLDNDPLISYLGNEFIRRNMHLDFNKILNLNQYSFNMIIKKSFVEFK